MNPNVRKILIDILAAHGPELAHQPNRIKGFLLDRCPASRREIAALVFAVESNAAQDLRQDNGDTSLSLLLPRLADRLYDEYGTDWELARWAMESWVEALELGQTSVVGGIQKQKIIIEQELQQDKSLNRKRQPANAEQLKNQLTYTKLGHGGVELPGDATQEQGWIMTRDNQTGLIWEIKTSANEAETYNWHGAQKGFIAKLNAEHFGGFSNWRLPTVDEVESIIDKNNRNPAINTKYFPNTVSSRHWSSSTYAYSVYVAWLVNFYDGYVSYGLKTSSHYVRAVHSE